jgi:3-(3-hydroxy-phenyl)propionate hydroxylase
MPDVRYYIDASDKLAALAFRGVKAELPAPPPQPALSPQGVIRYQGRQGRLDDILGWGFQLLCTAAPRLSPSQERFLTDIGGVVAAFGEDVVDVDKTYARFFAEHGVDAVLARPDFLICGMARTPAEVPTLLDALRVQLESSSR